MDTLGPLKYFLWRRVIFKILSQSCLNLQMERLYVTTRGGGDHICLAQQYIASTKHMCVVSEWTDGRTDGWIHFPLLLRTGWSASTDSMLPPSLGPGEQTPRQACPFSWPQIPGVIMCGLAWPSGHEGLRPPPSPPNLSKWNHLMAAQADDPSPAARASRMTRSSLAPTQIHPLSLFRGL